MSYTLNGKDLETLFGVTVTDGSDTFLAFPKRKKSLSHNYQDKNGIDIDLSEPYFEARPFKLSCALVADSRVLFWEKYNGLFTELSLPGILDLYISDLDKTFNIYYEDQQNVGKITALDGGEVCVKFDLLFSETDPADNMTAVYLVDEQDRFLIA